VRTLRGAAKLDVATNSSHTRRMDKEDMTRDLEQFKPKGWQFFLF
jgi:hypothetical protein